MSKKTFMRGALILGGAGIVVKILGAFFRIPLGNWIAAEGMAYYQTVYPIYNLLLTVATAGIPVAISRMVSERISYGNYWGANRVFKVSLYVMIVLGAILFSLSFFLADTIIGMIKGMDAAVYAMRAIAPALFLVPVMASFRGYFQGMQNMKPTAISQIFEQFFRVVVGLTLAYFLVSSGKPMAAAGATFGATAGAFVGLICVFAIYMMLKSTNQHKKKMRSSYKQFSENPEKASQIIKLVFVIAIPITLGAAIMPIMQSIDSILVINRLTETGWTELESKSMFGQLTAYANSLVNMPQVITQAVAISLVPTISAAFTQKDTQFMHHNVELGVRTAIIIGLPCSVGLFVLAEPILVLLYPLQKVDAIAAADALAVLSLGVVFLALVQTLTSILQGAGKQNIPAFNLLIGAMAKLILTYFLTGIPALNVRGAAIGTVAAYTVATILNFKAVKKYTGTSFEINITLVRPLASAAVMGIIAFLTHLILNMYIGNSMATLIAVAVGGAAYIILLFVTGAIREEELAAFPKGGKLVGLYRKVTRK